MQVRYNLQVSKCEEKLQEKYNDKYDLMDGGSLESKL